MGFAKYLRKLDVSENSKVYYGRFLRNGVRERYCTVIQRSKKIEMDEKTNL